jgi:2-polyprenyl-6-methoxyphenol hydroxylase-like FAD-dependent oxidoreductase
MRERNPKKDYFRDRAIIIGGSIAGLLSARVLADYFFEVVVVEKDLLCDRPEARKGVPQSVQPHVLLTKGYRILETLFPGIGADLAANGALAIDWVREFYHFSEVGWSFNANAPSEIVPSNILSFTCSRPLLEWTIRQQLTKSTNVKFIESRRVEGLLYNAECDRFTGVCLRSRDNTEERLLGDLIVDASGRSSQAPKWLENLGFSAPPETVINPRLGYVTRRYKAPKNFPADWKVMLISQAPPDRTRLGYLAKIENDEWIATLGGYGGDYPSLDNESFLNFARSLGHSKFYEIISQAEPSSEIYAYRATANRLRHFERIKLPQGFIAIGDAVCALCPVYGQGLTLSALAAMVLQNCLRRDALKARLRQRAFCSFSFQKSLAKEISLSWSLATTQDLRFPTTTGQRKVTRLGKIMNSYTQRLMTKATSNSLIHKLWIEVAHYLRSPLAFYHPLIVLQVMSRSQKWKEF